MDRNVDVRTPESIALTYALAGLGSRFLAVVLDTLVQIAVVLVVFVGIGLLFSNVPASAKHAVDSATEKIAQAVVIAFVVAFFFAVFFGYFIFFEAAWDGQTPGKKALGIRVVRDGGYPIDFGASLVRNLIRVGEMALGYYAIAAIAAVLSPENKRLGDMAAGTIVVRDARLGSPLELLRRHAEPAYRETRYLTAEERVLIKRFLERRDDLAPDRRFVIAAQLAARVRSRVPEDLQRLPDEALLERL
jgi:uncharacterized RDD family membrane protein YckC